MFIAGYSAPFTGALEMFGLSEHRLSRCCWLQEKKNSQFSRSCQDDYDDYDDDDDYYDYDDDYENLHE